MNKKTIIPIVFLIVALVAVSGCTSNNGNSTSVKNYTGNGVSFNYPGNWTLENQTSGNDTIMVTDLSSMNASRVTTSFQVQIIPLNGLTEQSALAQFNNTIHPSEWKKISNNTLTINDKTAYQRTYIANDTNYNQTMRYSEILFVKNGNIYILTLQAPDNTFDSVKSKFDTIINSLKIQ